MLLSEFGSLVACRPARNTTRKIEAHSVENVAAFFGLWGPSSSGTPVLPNILNMPKSAYRFNCVIPYGR